MNRKARSDQYADFRSNFAAWLKIKMAEGNLSNSDVAHAAGVSDSAVSMWKAQKMLPQLPSLAGIFRLFGVECAELEQFSAPKIDLDGQGEKE